LFFLPGTGVGWERGGNQTEVAWQYQGARTDTFAPASVDQPGGAGIAPFHIALEAGWRIYRGLSIGAALRLQIFTGATAGTLRTGTEVAPSSKAIGAYAGLVRVRYSLAGSRFHPTFHLDVGGGQIRHYIDLSSEPSGSFALVDAYSAHAYNSGDHSVRQLVCAKPTDCRDTIALGYFLMGVGTGFWVDLGHHVSFVTDFTLLGAVGGQSGLNFDLQLGVGAHFL
jgi:hypothetical protein